MTKTGPDLDWEMTGEGAMLLCLLHPLGMDRRFWQWLQADLTLSARFLLVDLPGHGRSPRPAGPYSIEDVAERVATILDRHGRAHLIGSSLGGMVALATAAQFPELTQSLVVADSTSRYADGFGWEERAATARRQGLAPLVDATLNRWFSTAALRAGGEAVDYVRDALSLADPEAYAQACEALDRADLTGVLSSIMSPALVIAGDEDPLADDSRQLVLSLPRARMRWLAGGKHAAPLEMRYDFATEVARFLAAVAM